METVVTAQAVGKKGARSEIRCCDSAHLRLTSESWPFNHQQMAISRLCERSVLSTGSSTMKDGGYVSDIGRWGFYHC